jgi:putative exporter of polyketide antibiotics
MSYSTCHVHDISGHVCQFLNLVANFLSLNVEVENSLHLIILCGMLNIVMLIIFFSIAGQHVNEH